MTDTTTRTLEGRGHAIASAKVHNAVGAVIELRASFFQRFISAGRVSRGWVLKSLGAI